MGKRSQGSLDKTTPWAQSREGWVAQLLEVFRENPDLSRFLVDGVLPPCFDSSQIYYLALHQVVWWDEVHRKCLIGDSRDGATESVIFPQNEDGVYDATGTYSDEQKNSGYVVQVKYENEGRWCAGVAMRLTANGVEEGVRADAFDYTGKRIVSVADWTKAVDSEIRRVKSLKPGDKGYEGWIESGRQEGVIYHSDKILILGRRHLNKMDKLGKVTCEKLASEGLTTVGDVIKHLDENKIDLLVAKFRGVTKPFLQKLSNVCSTAIMENAPSKVSHITHTYESRFGASCKERMAKCAALSKQCCVTEMVTHIIRESEKIYANTPFKDSWMFYHDALSLMTAKDCREWMKNQKISEDRG